MPDKIFPMGVTFYSYKGGAGRSVAAANVVHRLVNAMNRSTVMLDFDIESAGQGYIHGIDESWILGRGAKYQHWIYVQELLSGQRIVRGDKQETTEVIDIRRRDQFEKYASRFFYDIGRAAEFRFDPAASKEAPSGLLVMSRPVSEVSSNSSEPQQGAVLRRLFTDSARLLNVSFFVFDSPSGTQPLAHLARNWSDVLVVLCRPSKQFLEGTRHFLHRLPLLTQTPSLRNILLVLSAVPLEDRFRVDRETALTRLELIRREANDAFKGRKPEIRVTIPRISDEPKSAQFVIPEVTRLKWHECILTDAMASEDEEIRSAVAAYSRLAKYLVALRDRNSNHAND